MHGSPLPSLTVIVLNYRNASATVRCLESLAAARYPGPLDVVVLENGSRDESWAVLSAFAAHARLRLRLLRSETNLGFAGGVNRAWPDARGELVCLLNNDARVHPDCLRLLAEALAARTDLGAVGPYVAPAEWAETQRAPDPAAAGAGTGTQNVLGANIWLPLLPAGTCFSVSGVCLMVRRADHERPFLDEYFAYFEDVYLGWRLRLRGLACAQTPGAVVYHEGSATAPDDAPFRGRLARHAEKNRLVNLCLFYEPWTLARLAPLLLLDETKKLLVAAARAVTRHGATSYAGALLHSRWWLLAHGRWILAQRRRLQRERRVPDRELVALLSGRLTMERGRVADLLNRASLAWCRAVGLRTCERLRA